MSKTVPVCSGDTMFWAYDVALGVLLIEAVRFGAERPEGQRPPWWPELAAHMLTQALVGSAYAVLLDEFDPARRRDLLDCLLATARRIEVRGGVTREEVAAWPELEEEATSFLRGAKHIDPAPLVELAEAFAALADGTLPAAPPGRHWFYGTPAGRVVQGERTTG